MSSRQLRKLQKQKEEELLNLQHVAADKGGEESSEDEPIVTKPRGNMFSGFAALQDDDENENESSEEEPAHQAPQEQAVEQVAPAKTSKKSKKKKKKGKQTKPSAPAQNEAKSIDEVDRALEELKLEAYPSGGSVVAAPADKATNILDKLLRINLQHLKAINEMRMIFGKAIDVAELEQRSEGNQQPVRRGEGVNLETFLSASAGNVGQGNRGVFEATLRANPFVDGKRTWPPGTPLGLKMIRVSDESQDEVEFAFAHDSNYDSLESGFFGLVQMLDPMQIVTYLYRYPYHVSSLLQVSKVAQQDQNSALAADLIERAVFTFGRVSLNGFRKKLETGQARLSFARPENRQFYLAGFNLIQKLALKGTYLTALEWSKLLLSLNHDDPYAVVNWIHVLAIRAQESEWFIDFCNSPLFDDPKNVYAKQSLPLAHLQLDDTPTAISTLVEGMKTLPWLYCALFSALNLDTPQPVWGIQPRDDDEALHTKLYIHLTKELWSTPQRTSLLKQAAATIPTAISTRDLPPPTAVSLATTRFVFLDNAPALMAAVPRGMLHAASPNFEFDPFPPAREANLFSSPAQSLPWAAAE
ncbi:transcriptional repressor TCF25-domain-containing protein, partial [Chaetomium fimeti]